MFYGPGVVIAYLVRKAGGIGGEELNVKDRVEVAFHYVRVIVLWLFFCLDFVLRQGLILCLNWFV